MAMSIKETIEANLPRPFTIEIARLLCEGRATRVATAEARLAHESGKLYAYAATTGTLFRKSSDGR